MDWKALCAELAHEVQQYALDRGDEFPECLDRARPALAEPVGEGPTDEELMEAFDGEFAEFFDSSDGFGTTAIPRSEWIKVARAVLARWGHPAPAPVEGEVAELALKELERTMVLLMPVTGKNKIKRFDTIRAALKRLHELENKADLSPAPPAPKPAEGEVAELARLLRLDAHLERGDGMPQAAARFDRAADLLEQLDD